MATWATVIAAYAATSEEQLSGQPGDRLHILESALQLKNSEKQTYI